MAEIHSATLKVIQGGRLTIPQEIREVENIQEGDFVKVTIEKIERPEKL
jgi:bifunctional DNA-binding transcriptional regulator/antitoxin component of YhaV-PrlF toxin-antitoxin module